MSGAWSSSRRSTARGEERVAEAEAALLAQAQAKPVPMVPVTPETLRIGMPVRVVFEQHDDVWIPLFEPRPA